MVNSKMLSSRQPGHAVGESHQRLDANNYRWQQYKNFKAGVLGPADDGVVQTVMAFSVWDSHQEGT